MKEGPSGKALLCEGFHQGDLEGGLLYWGTRNMRFLKDAKCPVNTFPLHRDPVGEPGGGSFARTFERIEKYIWVAF